MRGEGKIADRTLAASARRSDRLPPNNDPGVGPVNTLAYIATIDDPRPLRHLESATAHLGLTRGSTNDRQHFPSGNARTRAGRHRG